MKKVIVISNDIVPGMARPVAAPGIRSWAIARGLREHGLEVDLVVLAGTANQHPSPGTPLPMPPQSSIVRADELSQYIEARSPCTVVFCNSNQIDHLRKLEGVRYVFDFFAPKMLELAYEFGSEYPLDKVERLRERKIRALNLADCVVVNGEKKLPYVGAWLEQTNHGSNGVPVATLNMPVPGLFTEKPAGLNLIIAGYIQGWNNLDFGLEPVLDCLDPPTVTLDVLAPVHWGQSSDIATDSPVVERLRARDDVTVHHPMNFSSFQRFMGRHHVAIDVFPYSLEREYAMVTRTVVAMSCGVPVVHPAFTEVGPIIEEMDAGWIIEPSAPEVSLAAILREIVSSPELVKQKAENARKAWERYFDPVVAVTDLANFVLRGDVRV